MEINFIQTNNHTRKVWAIGIFSTTSFVEISHMKSAIKVKSYNSPNVLFWCGKSRDSLSQRSLRVRKLGYLSIQEILVLTIVAILLRMLTALFQYCNALLP